MLLLRLHVFGWRIRFVYTKGQEPLLFCFHIAAESPGENEQDITLLHQYPARQ